MSVPITALYASLLTLMFLGLAVRVSRLRRTHRIGVGNGEVPELALAVRVHGNFIEYVPLALLLLLLLELNGTAVAWLHAFGLLLLVGRILHAVGLGQSAGVSFGRFAGTVLTWLLLAASALANLWLILAD